MTESETDGSDAGLVARAVRELGRRTRFPVTFGGLIERGAVHISSISGNRTRHLEGLTVHPERGLGGRAMIELRPRMTSDYRGSRQFTHDYDGYVLGEGLRTLLAVPLIIGGRSRGMLYAGAWEESSVGGVVTAPAMKVAEGLATELRVREEVERRLRAQTAGAPGLRPSQQEELRASFAELRRITADIADEELRARLGQVERRLLAVAGETAHDEDGSTRLSRRETDVLACVAIGATNAQIAEELQLREGTVKAYLGSAMSKLDATTRHAAVSRARLLNLLP